MVYVDDMKAKFGQMTMCHMLADTTGELNRMADKIGVKRKWIQNPGTYLEHYDICLSKRALAVRYGAKQIVYGKELALLLAAKRKKFEK
jgi:Protein of unknown function (DUF4031)